MNLDDQSHIKFQNIAIIGCGLSGLLILYNIIRNHQNPNCHLKIRVFDNSPNFPKGIAYSTKSFNHLLNVRASGMGITSLDRRDFLIWLKKKGYQYEENDFVPRKIFGYYLEEILSISAETAKQKNIDLKIEKKEIGSLKFIENQFLIEDELYDHCVLATGSKMKNSPNNFWNLELEKLINEPEIHILGCGLTAIDAALSLHEMNYLGKIFLHSRRGKLPQVHKLSSNQSSLQIPLKLEDSSLPLSEIFKKFVQTCKKSENWRATFDSFRPLTQQFWSSLNLAKKERFLRHCLRMWNIHRHRCPESQFGIIEKLLTSKKLVLEKGAILNSSKIVDCTGFDYRLQSGLIENLINNQIVEKDPLSLGIISKYDNFYIGSSLNFGSLFEITSAPDIAPQARKISEEILHQINQYTEEHCHRNAD